MSKAILILDKMPSGCNECNYLGFQEVTEDRACMLTTNRLIIQNVDELDIGRDIACPLKPIPQKKKVKKITQPKDFIYTEIQYDIIANKIMGKINYDVETIFTEGYNSCLDEILEGEEE